MDDLDAKGGGDTPAPETNDDLSERDLKRRRLIPKQEKKHNGNPLLQPDADEYPLENSRDMRKLEEKAMRRGWKISSGKTMDEMRQRMEAVVLDGDSIRDAVGAFNAVLNYHKLVDDQSSEDEDEITISGVSKLSEIMAQMSSVRDREIAKQESEELEAAKALFDASRSSEETSPDVTDDGSSGSGDVEDRIPD